MSILGLRHLETRPDFYVVELDIHSVKTWLLYPVAYDLLYWLAQAGFYRERNQIGIPLVLSSNGAFSWRGHTVHVQNQVSATALFHNKNYTFGRDKASSLGYLDQNFRLLLQSANIFLGKKTREFVQDANHLVDFFGHGNNISLFLNALQRCHEQRVAQHRPQVAAIPKTPKRGLWGRIFGGQRELEPAGAK